MPRPEVNIQQIKDNERVRGERNESVKIFGEDLGHLIATYLEAATNPNYEGYNVNTVEKLLSSEVASTQQSEDEFTRVNGVRAIFYVNRKLAGNK